MSVVVIGFNGPPSSVDNQDFATIIDGLLRRPLMYLHADQIRELKAKEKHSGLTEVDKIYISDIWNKFRSLPEARVEEGQSEEPGGAVAEQTLELAGELKRLNITVEKLRAALKQVAEHRDRLKDQVEKLTKVAELPDSQANRRFEKTKIAFAKFYHPNTLAGYSHLDMLVRGEVFREFWPELERIEAEG